MSKPITMSECHSRRVHYAHGLCKSCYNIEWQKNHVEYTRAKQNMWRKTNPNTSKAGRKRHRLAKYGLTEEQYATLWEIQDGVCAMCARTEPSGRLCVDHNHKTNLVRGLLCNLCNRALGFYEKYASSAIEYLAIHE